MAGKEFVLGALLISCAVCLHADSGPAAPERPMAKVEWSARETRTGRFVGVSGQRAFAGGYASSGLEVWAYPLQILSRYRVSFRLDGDATGTDGETVLRNLENTPAAETRVYAGAGFRIRERIFVPADAPAAAISYSVESSRPVLITVHFAPSLNLMWPAAVGGQAVRWDAEDAGYLLEEPTHRFHAAILSRQIVSHDDVQNNTRNAEFDRSLAFTLRVEPGSSDDATISMAGSSIPGEDALTLAKELAAHPREFEARANARYAGLQLVKIETPDEVVNRALRWAQIALEQAWVCNPQLGCGLVAGYGPSRGARRPQYDWFFAGDGLVAVNALLREGAYARAQEELAFILRYQDKRTGMIWHELSQSAGFLDWAQYPYMFVHVDISFDFLNSMLDYTRTTGDTAFVNDHWDAIRAAYEYCRSTIDAKDGLPRIPAGKEGGDEQDPLGDELTLSANWVKAASSFATLAVMTNHDQVATEASAASERAQRSIQPRYYDAGRRLWITGHLRSGAPVEGLTSSSVGLLHLGLLSREAADIVLDRLAAPATLTPWGIRSRSSDASNYDPESYAGGSVWATGTADAAMALWNAQRPATAFNIWHALVPWSELDAPGHMHEVLAGDAFRPERESVPEQTWSSAAFLSSAISGLLGVQVDGLEHRLRFAPQIPQAWNSLEVHRLKVGGSDVSLSLKRSHDDLELRIENSGPALECAFAPPLVAGARIQSAALNGKPMHFAASHAKEEGDIRFVCGAKGVTHISLHSHDRK